MPPSNFFFFHFQLSLLLSAHAERLSDSRMQDLSQLYPWVWTSKTIPNVYLVSTYLVIEWSGKYWFFVLFSFFTPKINRPKKLVVNYQNRKHLSFKGDHEFLLSFFLPVKTAHLMKKQHNNVELEGAARNSGLLLAPAEGFGPCCFLTFGQKRKSFLYYFGHFGDQQ